MPLEETIGKDKNAIKSEIKFQKQQYHRTCRFQYIIIYLSKDKCGSVENEANNRASFNSSTICHLKTHYSILQQFRNCS